MSVPSGTCRVCRVPWAEHFQLDPVAAQWTTHEFFGAVNAWRLQRWWSAFSGTAPWWDVFAPKLLVRSLTLVVWGRADEPMRRLSRRQWLRLFETAGYAEVDAERLSDRRLATQAVRPAGPVRLYRGADARGRLGMSWTPSRRVALNYAAARAATMSTATSLYTALVPPGRLLGRRIGREFGSDEYVVDTRGLEVERLGPATGRFHPCTCGEEHWGAHGAAGLLLVHGARTTRAGSVLLQQRGWATLYGGRWGLPGGALEAGESPVAGALRETREEVGIDAGSARVLGEHVDDHGPWRYTTVIAAAPRRWPVHPDPEETLTARWVPLEDVATLELHPGFEAAWPALHRTLVETGA